MLSVLLVVFTTRALQLYHVLIKTAFYLLFPAVFPRFTWFANNAWLHFVRKLVRLHFCEAHNF